MTLTLENLRQQYRPQILELADKHGVHNIRVFGSVARGESCEKSDVDFLVELDRDRSLLDFIGFKLDVEGLLDHPVDVLSEKGLHWYVRPHILAEAQVL